MKISIIVKNNKHGIHCYQGAPEEVIHLRKPHRHNFLFTTKISVKHDDRELEFFMVQDFIQSELDKLPHDLQTSSCEQLAKAVIKMIHEKYGDRDVTCTVSEDGQNAAVVEYSIEHFIEGLLYCDTHGPFDEDSIQHKECKETGCILRRVSKS